MLKENIGIIALSLASLTFTGCDDAEVAEAQVSSIESMDPAERNATKEARLASVKDLGNGVFVFGAQRFAETLSDFKEKNPHLVVTAISPNRDGQYGTTNFLISVEQRGHNNHLVPTR